MTTRKLARWLSLPLLLVALGAAAQSTMPVDLEMGVRWRNVTGNRDMYRTQINETNGLLLRALSISSPGFGDGSLVDFFRVDASDIGAGPAGSIRLDTGKSGKYRLRVGFRRTRFFSALPEFANPLLDQGVIPGQHTYDRSRKMLDIDLDILPNNKIAPFLGYSSNRYSGPGTTTYHLGQDEFLLNQDLRNVDQEVRAGFSFTTSNFYGAVTQGWRHYTADEDFSLAGPANGNNTAPVLGRDITASQIDRSGHDSGSTPFTNLELTGAFDPRFKLVGSYVRFAADAHGSESELDAGSFASFELGRFFSGITEQINDRAKNTTWRGGVRGEFEVYENIDLLAGFQREHRELEGSALINTLYLNSITFGGADPRTLPVLVDANNSLSRSEDLMYASLFARPAGPLTFRIGISETTQDITVTPDLSEIVIPGPSQGGSFSRKIDTFDVLGTYAAGGFSLGASWKHDHADSPILRTDFVTRDRSRLRASWTGGANNRYRFGIMAEENTPKNDANDFQYKSRIRQLTADGGIAPIEALRFYASASTYRADTNILYIRPQTLAIDTSEHREDGQSAELGATISVTKFSLDAALSRFRNDGTYPFKINRARARATYDFTDAAGFAVEWDRDEYTEAPVLGNYDANRYGIYLRLRR